MSKFWGDKSGQEKADSFDAQWNKSKRSADKKKALGVFPYDMDASAAKAGKAPTHRKRRRGDKG